MTACSWTSASRSVDLKHVVIEERCLTFGLAFLVQQTGRGNFAHADIGAIQHHAGLQKGPHFIPSFVNNAGYGLLKPSSSQQ